MSQKSPELAGIEAMDLINRRGSIALVGLPSTQTAQTVARIAEQSQTPMISILASSPGLTRERNFVFSLNGSDLVHARLLARFANERLGPRCAVLVEATSTYGLEIVRNFSHHFVEGGGEIVAKILFTPEDTDLDSKISDLVSSAPDAVFFPTFSELTPVMAERARAAGLSAPFLSGDAWIRARREDLARIGVSYFLDLWLQEETRAPTASFVREFVNRHGTHPSTSAALAYDAVSMVLAVIEQRASADPRDIQKGLAELTGYPGVTGIYSFTKGSGDPNRPFYIRKVDREGRVTLFETIPPATAKN